MSTYASTFPHHQLFLLYLSLSPPPFTLGHDIYVASEAAKLLGEAMIRGIVEAMRGLQIGSMKSLSVSITCVLCRDCMSQFIHYSNFRMVADWKFCLLQ